MMTSARYTLCNHKIPSGYPTAGTYARTPAYVFTVDSLDDPTLQQLRANCKQHNKSVRAYFKKHKELANSWSKRNALRLMRVAVMPRGPRRAPARKDFGYRKCSHYSHYDSYLPSKYATHFDVYYRPDTTAEANFNSSI